VTLSPTQVPAQPLAADHIARHGVGAERGPLRDAATLFDENAALLHAPQRLIDALRERDWRRLFIDRRDLWQHSSLILFGHALLEKLVRPRTAITAVPGWWPDNEAPSFYDDAAVFRPQPGRKPSIDRYRSPVS